MVVRKDEVATLTEDEMRIIAALERYIDPRIRSGYVEGKHEEIVIRVRNAADFIGTTTRNITPRIVHALIRRYSDAETGWRVREVTPVGYGRCLIFS